MRIHPVRAKLRSQQGASILFALFFFIVCAVIGSIVLTAATAAAGRMKDVKQNNKNYYAVNSAVELLESALNDPTRTKIELSKTWMGTGNYVNNHFEGYSPPNKGDYWKDPEVTGQGLAYALYTYPLGSTDGAPRGELQLNHGYADDPLNVWICEIDPGAKEYDREVKICSGDRQYSLILNCVAHVDERVDTKEIGRVVKYKDGVGEETRNIQETTTKTITWTVTSVTKGGAVSVKTNSNSEGT